MERSQLKFRGLGSHIVLTVIADSNTNSQAVLDKLRQQIKQFENAFSRFTSTSELTKFNDQAGKKVEITVEFRDLLLETVRLSSETDGLFNPFILPNLQNAGYLESLDKSPQKVINDYRKRLLSSIEELEIGDKWARIPEKSAIDLGGIGKGFLLDRLALSLRKEKTTNYWLSLGGDIICSGYDIDNRPWQIGIASAFNEEIVDTILKQNDNILAIATSGVAKRQGVNNNMKWHHIIDPRTGLPSSTNIVSATVTGWLGSEVDVYAKSIVIEGSSLANKLKRDQKILNYYIQTKNKTTIKG